MNEEKVCHICDTAATGTVLDTEIHLCSNLACHVAMLEQMCIVNEMLEVKEEKDV